MDPVSNAKAQMGKAVEVLRADLGTIRAGRANPAILEHVRIKVYGGTQELTVAELGTITNQDAQTLIVTPFDQSIIDELDRGLMQANLGLTVSQDGQTIRVVTPPLTQERREEFIKLAKSKTEGVKIMVRQIRQDQMNLVRKKEQDKEIAEDERFRLEKEIQKIVDETMESLDALLTQKTTELQTL
jgi:ribosome recycling factor